jgi:isopentenyl-diphosphate delta-isomerase
MDGDEETAVNETQRWLTQTRQLLALLGAHTPAAATGIDVLLRGRVREFSELRGIDPAAFARRTYN